MGNIGIFGGSFNPVHRGHLLVAETALKAVDLDPLIWVPTYRPTHKPACSLSFAHRLAMVELAIAHQPRFRASDVSAWRDEPSYAIATLKALQAQYPDNQWFWILGMDAFQTLEKWYQSDVLRAQCTWLVAPRDPLRAPRQTTAIVAEPQSSPPSNAYPLRWHLLDMTPLAISSSQIRCQHRQGESIDDTVPPLVREYIGTHGLY
jgi:nicotinate-nucleotide adenylyltransferase